MGIRKDVVQQAEAAIAAALVGVQRLGVAYSGEPTPPFCWP